MLTNIYNQHIHPDIARTKLAHWYSSIEALGSKFFNSVIQTMQNHHHITINYFENRITNASAESVNAEVKAFRAQFRGLLYVTLFLDSVKFLLDVDYQQELSIDRQVLTEHD